ncbi:MAG: hypothetical protein CSA42_02645 [Gammaproteobacteria bacterium]|nr:MAG: hypothetical protein CSA42_02645 [Gammaproteobacteria bacterium]
MSNLSNIGFDIQNEEDFYSLVERAYEKSSRIKTKQGSYFKFSDESGAQLWIQMNSKNELIGANPHFEGKSKRKVSLTASIDRQESILDGAFHSWADPLEKDNPESDSYPFVFDVPDHKRYEEIEFPQTVEIQLSAFAQEFDYYESEDEFLNGQEGEPKWASQSFVPSGLFNPGEGEDPNSPEAFGLFAGIIRESAKRKNLFTGQEFYWMLVDTLGGEIDVIADLRYFVNSEPKKDGVVHGQFWLSGCLLSEPKSSEKRKKGFLNRVFGN